MQKKVHDQIVSLVLKLMDTKNDLAQINTDKETKLYSRYCASLSAQIDALIYQIYNLSGTEIKIVESQTPLEYA